MSADRSSLAAAIAADAAHSIIGTTEYESMKLAKIAQAVRMETFSDRLLTYSCSKWRYGALHLLWHHLLTVLGTLLSVLLSVPHLKLDLF